MNRVALFGILLLFGTAIFIATRPDDGDDPQPGGPSAAELEKNLVRDRVAALASNEEWNLARRALEPLVEGDDSEFDDLITAAVLELRALEPHEQVRAYLERARALQPEAAVLTFLEARLFDLNGELEQAEVKYRATLAQVPEDPATKYLLAMCIRDLDMDGTLIEEAITLFEDVETMGIDAAGPWYVSTVFGLAQTYSMYLDDLDREQRYTTLWDQLHLEGHRPLKLDDLNEGELARILPPPILGNFASGAVTVPSYSASETLAPALGGGGELLTIDLDGDLQLDLASAGEDGVKLALREPTGPWRPEQTAFTGPARLLRAIDLHKDDSLDFVFVSGNELRIVECSGGAGEETWADSPLAPIEFPDAPSDIELCDVDHDGDLDLVVVGSFGLRLLRNDGAGVTEKDQPRGGFTDAADEMGLEAVRPLLWCISEDFDDDQDLDLLVGGPNSTILFTNLRGGRFQEATPSGLEAARETEPLAADFDGDARVDLLESPGRLWRQTSAGQFMSHDTGAIPAARLHQSDLDLDGRLDAVWQTEDGTVSALFAVGFPEEKAGELLTGAGPLSIGDVTDIVDARRQAVANELCTLESGGVQVHATTDVNAGVRLRFRGKKDNRQGLGAVVEIRAGNIYRRHMYRGKTELYGLGDAPFADVVRMRWPNGVVQNEVDVEPNAQMLDDFGEQKEGLIGSCPFLYTWNGETFTFISDVLGITPLGLPMAPGMLVPPDHDEYVLVTGDQLVPNEDGELVLQFTEELREVTYLDHLRLEVIDHPAGSEVQPNERFCFPPFPTPRTHVMDSVHPPTRVTGSDGQDWTAALAAVDDTHPTHFKPLTDGQFLGLAEPHWLELEFDSVPDEGELRLICTGWFFWTDASVNVATARTPGIDFVPPIIEVPNGDEWQPIGPPVGFPAGKTKSMVIDLTDHLDRDNPRLRIGSSLRLYWDSIRLATGGDLEIRQTSLAATSAHLWPRGFSRSLTCEREDMPERFEWDELEARARWSQHPGRYTRFGEVRELVDEVDDCMVVMGSGDCLTVKFDAGEMPELEEGWTRSYLVYLDGWAKDRDPNTVEALTVEPLPFHGMSGYPYGADEAFPDNEKTRAWKRDWQTREALELVVPLSPTRFEEWCEETFIPRGR